VAAFLANLAALAILAAISFSSAFVDVCSLALHVAAFLANLAALAILAAISFSSAFVDVCSLD
jgi:hypothetical protein